MYISPGCVEPTFVQNTSSRGPSVAGSASSARMRGSGCLSESVLTPVCVRMPRMRPPPCAAFPRPRHRARRALSPAARRDRAASACRAGWRRVGVLDPLGRRAAVALELRLDPIHRFAVAFGALAPVAELRETLDRRLVLLEVEARDHEANRIVQGVRGRRLVAAALLRVNRRGGEDEQRGQNRDGYRRGTMSLDASEGAHDLGGLDAGS